MIAKFEKSAIWIILLFIVFLGSGLRFSNLSKPSIWIDELNHYYPAEGLIESGEPTMPSGFKYDRAILYSRLVSYSFQLFGSNEFSLRLPSALLGVLCIIVAFLIARRFFGNTCAVLTALFVAVSPFVIGWARLSRMYTLFQFLFMIAAYAFYRGFESDNRGLFHRWQHKVLSIFKNRAFFRLLELWRINLFWLILAGIVFLISFSVHNITALFFVGFLFYVIFMFLSHWWKNGFQEALKSKYFAVFICSTALTILAFLISSKLRGFASHAINYIPPWAIGTRFQDRKLYFDFIFDHYNFPMGAFFVIGAYQILSRIHRSGIYIFSIFAAYVFMFTIVFSYRHFQYIYNVYPFFIMVSAFAFSNIIGHEFDVIKKNWFTRSKLNSAFLKGVIVCCFLVWLPLTPSLRLSRRIPLSGDGGFNGAIYLDEWREACGFVKTQAQEDDLIISTDPLGTLHYLGKIDFCLNFSAVNVARENNFKSSSGNYRDIYSGAPFIEDLSHLKELVNDNSNVFLLAQHYKLLEAAVFIPEPIRNYVLSNFEEVLATQNGTVLVYQYKRAGESPQSFEQARLKIKSR